MLSRDGKVAVNEMTSLSFWAHSPVGNSDPTIMTNQWRSEAEMGAALWLCHRCVDISSGCCDKWTDGQLK